jgi:DNA-binding response OmpR family regulator
MTLAPEAGPRRHKLVVGVDDDIDQLIVLQGYIDGAGYTFMGTTSGEECLKLVDRVPVRLIILDVMMPGMDGFETCRRLRQKAALAALPILLLTARQTEADVRKATAVGADDFLIKPIDPAVVIARVDYWLDRTLPAILASI